MTRQTVRVLKIDRIRQPAHNAMIGVGDLARAVGLLEPTDDETLRAIAAALGFEVEPPEMAEATVQSAPTDRPEVPPQPEDFTRRRVSSLSVPPPSPFAPGAEIVSFEIERKEATAPKFQAANAQATLLETKAVRPPLAPLFRPHWARAIVSNALATDGEHGPLDLEAVVDFFARREHVTELPRLPWPTLRRGVQLLIDRSPALSPFWRDQDHLHHGLVEVAGRDKVQAFTFRGFPLPSDQPDDDLPWGTYPLRSEAEALDENDDLLGWSDVYKPPLAGTVVLLLTDLGIGRTPSSNDRASVQHWLDFAALVRKAGCPLVAFVPYPPARWPVALRHAVKIVQWDRSTTAVVVRHIIGRAHLVKGI